ncbi:MAG TPA: hypothetical protein VGO47_10050, partial [Chlamydiales bacterium]|nr:hypothetical protein [Chlamydiales bacterium]
VEVHERVAIDKPKGELTFKETNISKKDQDISLIEDITASESDHMYIITSEEESDASVMEISNEEV